jgi:hypothetical protein
MKKLMLFALVAVSALLALPTFAAATPAHVSSTGNFTLHGGALLMERTDGTITHGTTLTGVGSFENTTTGTLEFALHGLTAGFETCTSTGQPAGTVKTTKLPFHLVMLAPGKPGILITPGPIGHVASYVCFGLINVVMNGNGILGTITSPACGSTSNKATLRFEQSIPGHQKHNTYTGVNYGFTTSLSGGAAVPTSLNAAATITFPANRTLTCT